MKKTLPEIQVRVTVDFKYTTKENVSKLYIASILKANRFCKLVQSTNSVYRKCNFLESSQLKLLKILNLRLGRVKQYPLLCTVHNNIVRMGYTGNIVALPFIFLIWFYWA